jgi:hypothetical protein
MTHEFIKTTRDGEALVCENFLFRLAKRMPTGRRYWKCSTFGCLATATTDGHTLVRACTAVAHNHASDDVAIQRMKFLNDLKNEVIIAGLHSVNFVNFQFFKFEMI